jgi:hypothetical protein
LIVIYLQYFSQVTHELNALDNLHKVAANENLPKYDTALIVDALLESHSEVILVIISSTFYALVFRMKVPHAAFL